jgi:hypothetical protein
MAGWGVASLAALVLGASPALASSGPLVRHAPKRFFGRGTSTNWSGYTVDGSNATYVTGTWTQPTSLNCSAVPSSWSSPWVGIDGDTSNTVEQIGTDSDCSRGTPSYYAWYEMYPKSLVTIPMTVVPGHSYTGTVAYASSTGGFVMTLTDNTTKASYTTTQYSKKVKRASVEWIMEGPSSGSLTGFGTIGFTAASGTIGGVSGLLDPAVFPHANPITMVTSQGGTRAAPSSPPSNGSFSVSWQHA